MLSVLRPKRTFPGATASALKWTRQAGHFSTMPGLQSQAAAGVTYKVPNVFMSQEPQPDSDSNSGILMTRHENAGLATGSVRSHGSRSDGNEDRLFWQKIPQWKDVSEADFLSYRFSVSIPRSGMPWVPQMLVLTTEIRMQVANTVQGTPKLLKFLQAVLPDQVPGDEQGAQGQSRDEFIKDVLDGVTTATMAIRIT
jgi:hypothetical protein